MTSITSLKQAIPRGSQPLKQHARRSPIAPDNRSRNGFGHKEIYLPSFRITLLASPKLPPQYATFQVPLSFNKFDMRDYLFHVYGIKSRSIRSAIYQSPVQKQEHYEPDPDGPLRKIRPVGKAYRPQSTKRMMVEMDKPFIWPEQPENFEGWEQEAYKLTNAASTKELQNRYADRPWEFDKRDDKKDKKEREKLLEPFNDRNVLKQQAQDLLSGKTKWQARK